MKHEDLALNELKDVEWGSAMVGPYRVDKVSATYDEGPEYDCILRL